MLEYLETGTRFRKGDRNANNGQRRISPIVDTSLHFYETHHRLRRRFGDNHPQAKRPDILVMILSLRMLVPHVLVQ